MRAATKVSLAMCSIGAAPPIVWIAMRLSQRLLFFPFAAMMVGPFVAAALAAWLVRADERRSVVVMTVSVFLLATGIWGGRVIVRSDVRFFEIPAIILVPFVALPLQTLALFVGAIVAGRMENRTE